MDLVCPSPPFPVAKSLRHQPLAAVPRLSVVIVNYRSWEETGRLVRQIRKTLPARQGAVEVVVVDNHSPGHPLVPKLRRWRGVSLRRWGRNRGFARAANEGCRLSQGDWFLLLNPDVTLTEGFVEQALALADRLTAAEPRTGVVGFRVRNADGSRQHSAGPWPTLWSTLAGLAWPRARRKYRPLRSSRRRQVEWVTGCCFLVRRDCFQEVGGFDRSFFLYYEDVDFCRRARSLGWAVWHEPAVSVVHLRPLHDRPLTPLLRLITRHALLTYAGKHWLGWQTGILASLVGLEARLRGWWARWRGHSEEAKIFLALHELVAALGRRQPGRARRRLNQEVWRAEDFSPSWDARVETLDSH